MHATRIAPRCHLLRYTALFAYQLKDFFKCSAARRAPPGLHRQTSEGAVRKLNKYCGKLDYFVAELTPLSQASQPRASPDDGEMGNELIDKREDFWRQCETNGWQFSELRRAQYATMMMLAKLGQAESSPMLEVH